MGVVFTWVHIKSTSKKQELRFVHSSRNLFFITHILFLIQALRELAKKHPSVVTLVQLGICAFVFCFGLHFTLQQFLIFEITYSFFLLLLDVADQCSIKESAKKVGSLLGKNGLNLLVNNAAVTTQKNHDDRHFLAASETLDAVNVFNQEYLPYLSAATKAKGRPGMSCNKAAVINISTDSASMSIMPVMKEPFPLFPYSISKADEILCISIHPGWMRTDMGGDEASIDVRESVEGMLCVIGSLPEKQNGAFLDYTGKTMPW
ncbi:uncharacterized protein LOC107711147 [Sinocyclocheilus rhinocerous]|uniref:uncharacterized protein LOC107711147 n=1 Tax=Sinocyclocheilus rhinocerous TaxID=307959 RepID=UPI0007B97BCF|nr:PREDICTED: uncharacterized protein LOC107711147 [Sinocyclocheilus rhinocerous]